MHDSGLDVAPLHDAVRGGRSDVMGVAREVGASAAQLGVPLHEVMDHVERAFAPRAPAFGVVRAAATAWAELALIHHADISCEDPLTSMASVPYVRSRLGEIYRGAESAGRRASDLVALVVVEPPRLTTGHELEQALRAIDVAEALRLVFTADETIAQLAPRRFAALAAREHADDATVALLRLLVDRVVGQRGQSRIWVEHLPASIDGVAHLLAVLGS